MKKVIAIFWYPEDQYDAIRSACEDSYKLPATHAAFLERAREVEDGAKASGYGVIKVEADLDVFRVWCRSNGFKMDEKGRAAFAEIQAAEQLRRG